MSRWIGAPLGELTSKIGSGATPLGGEAAYQAEGISLIRSLNVHDGEFRRKDLAFLSQQQADGLANVVVQSNDVLLNITGASIARCCTAPADVLPARVNQHVAIVRPLLDRISPRFLQYLLVSPSYKDRLLSTGEGAGSTRQALTKAQLQSFFVEFPDSLQEQARIVAILDEAFEGIATAKANAEKNLLNAQELFRSHLEQVFLRHWATSPVQPLEALTESDSPITYGVVKPGTEGDVAFVRGGDIAHGRVLTEQLRTIDATVSRQYRRTLLRGGELLISLVGQPGQVAVAPQELKGANIARQVGLIRLSEQVDAEYVRYFLQSPVGQAALGAKQSGSVQQVINLGELREVLVPIPALAVQRETTLALEAFSESVERLTDLVLSKRAALDELKKSLLHQAFSGKLTSKDPGKQLAVLA
jgi:type I restriction enzyme S subunit